MPKQRRQNTQNQGLCVDKERVVIVYNLCCFFLIGYDDDDDDDDDDDVKICLSHFYSEMQCNRLVLVLGNAIDGLFSHFSFHKLLKHSKLATTI